jgi:heme-degrading monooxygenase HmoA
MKGNIWEFHVKEGCERQFMAMNRVSWPNFFMSSPRYRSTEIAKNIENPLIYVTVDKWNSQEDFEEFKKANRSNTWLLRRTTRAFTRARGMWAGLIYSPAVSCAPCAYNISRDVFRMAYSLSPDAKAGRIIIEAEGKIMALLDLYGLSIRHAIYDFLVQYDTDAEGTKRIKTIGDVILPASVLPKKFTVITEAKGELPDYMR